MTWKPLVTPWLTPFQSMFIALFSEPGTIAALPIAVATIGSADGPMVRINSLLLAKHLFVTITVVGYLYLGLT